MSDHAPITPVQIEWGDFRALSSVADLARCLLHDWPAVQDGEAYVTALLVCSAVLNGGEDDEPDHARAAFIDAAHEAGLSVADDDNGPDF